MIILFCFPSVIKACTLEAPYINRKVGKEIKAIAKEKYEKLVDLTDLSSGEKEVDDPNIADQIVDAAISQSKKDGTDVKETIEKVVATWVKQLSDRQTERINASDDDKNESRLDHLLRLLREKLPPNVEPPISPNEIEIAGNEWVQEYKLDDPASALGNDANFSPNQAKKLIDLLPTIVKQLQDPESDGKDNDQDGETDEKGEEVIGDSLYRRWGVLAGIIKG